MFYLAKCELRTNSCRITISQRTTNLFIPFLKIKIQTFKYKHFEVLLREKSKQISQPRRDFINGHTHKNTGGNRGDLRSLQHLSSEPLHNQNEKQAQQAKLLGIHLKP